MSDSLDDVMTPVRDGDGWRLVVEDGWQQGRGAFGGLVLGALCRALEAEAGARALRSLSAQLMAPVVTGEARIAVELLRAGNAVSTLRATLLQAGALAAHATAIFGADRPGTPSWRRLQRPHATPFRELPETRLPTPPAPAFTRHFDMRVAEGFIFSGGTPRGQVVGWVRPRAAARRRDAALAVALADCFYPVVLAELGGPRPTATVDFHLEMCAGLDGLDPEAPFLHRAVAPSADGGYAVEHRELWGDDGRLVALNQQIFVVIK